MFQSFKEMKVYDINLDILYHLTGWKFLSRPRNSALLIDLFLAKVNEPDVITLNFILERVITYRCFRTMGSWCIIAVQLVDGFI